MNRKIHDALKKQEYQAKEMLTYVETGEHRVYAMGLAAAAQTMRVLLKEQTLATPNKQKAFCVGCKEIMELIINKLDETEE